MNEPTLAPQTQTPEPNSADLALAAAYQTAPAHIKAYLDSGQLADVMIQLQNTYGLHIDVTEKVAKELVLTLLGIVPPTEFPINLRVIGGIQEGYIEAIINDVNRLIFVPLSGQTKSGSVSVPVQAPISKNDPEWIEVSAPIVEEEPGQVTEAPSAPPLRTPPAPSYGTQQTQWVSVSAPQSTPAPSSISSPSTRAVPAGYESVLGGGTPPATPPLPQAPVYQAPTSQQPPPIAPLPPKPEQASPYEQFHAQARTMAEDMAALKQGGGALGGVLPPPQAPYPSSSLPPEPPAMPQIPKNAGSVPTPPPPRTIPAAYQDVAPAPPPIAPPVYQTPAPRAVPTAYQDVLMRPAPPLGGTQSGYSSQGAPPPHVPGNDPYREPVE